MYLGPGQVPLQRANPTTCHLSNTYGAVLTALTAGPQTRMHTCHASLQPDSPARMRAITRAHRAPCLPLSCAAALHACMHARCHPNFPSAHISHTGPSRPMPAVQRGRSSARMHATRLIIPSPPSRRACTPSLTRARRAPCARCTCRRIARPCQTRPSRCRCRRSCRTRPRRRPCRPSAR